MFAGLAIAICVLGLWASYMGDLPVVTIAFLWQLMAVLLVLLGLFSNDTQRDKSVLTVTALWFSWVMLTDMWPEYLAPEITGLETALFSFFVLWAFARPYFYVSHSLESRGENVLIGFYRGTNAPLLSSLGALLGLPFSSIIIVGGVTMLRASANGKMVIGSPDAIRQEDYVFINTGKKSTQKIFEAIAKCQGKKTRAFGIFRTKCIRNCQPVLEMLGLQPKSWFHLMPSVFYYQCVEARNGIKN